MSLRPVIALALSLVVAGPALAQAELCGERSDLVAQLQEGHLDKPGAQAATAHGAMVELVRAEDGRWRLILHFPTGRSCQLAAGDALGALEAKLVSQTF